MATQGSLSPTARVLLGLFCSASGVMPALATFDLGPLDSSAIHGPRWLGLLAGGIFMAGGIAVMLDKRLRNSAPAYGLFAGIIGAFACIANWVAFGPGPRECTIAFAGFLFETGSRASEIACRGGFGIGAVLLDGFVLWMIAAARSSPDTRLRARRRGVDCGLTRRSLPRLRCGARPS